LNSSRGAPGSIINVEVVDSVLPRMFLLILNSTIKLRIARLLISFLV
jgi:hypothetical protein